MSPVARPMAGAQVAATVVRVIEVPDGETVDAFHAAAVEAGSTTDGPGCDLTITSGYYAAFVLDPDGNVEAVFHGDH
jgi:predicted lactoylglutathione lyase